MKKTCNSIGRKFILLLTTCLFLFSTGCGLDVFYMIDPPYSVIHQPEYTNEINYEERYFEFWTNESTDIEGFNFKGTRIYYRIYNNYSKMTSEVSSLQSLSNDTEKSATAADKMINNRDSGGYGYKILRYSNERFPDYIPTTISNKRVFIRLTDYQGLYDYSSRVVIKDNGEEKSLAQLYGISDEKTLPLRFFPDNRTFNFGRSGPSDFKPTSEDDDVTYDSDTKTPYWYVAMFAVGIGEDANYTDYYSNILYLGSIRIDSTSQDN